MNTPVPYIGITDFTDIEQVINMQQALEEEVGINQLIRIHVGIMMGFNTLNNNPLEKEWEKAVTPKEKISGIFISQDVLNFIHYADYANRPNLSGNLARAMPYGGVLTHGIQLDMIWPDPKEIKTFLTRFSHAPLEIILQINPTCLEQVDNDVSKLLRKIDSYHSQGLVHRILLDMSMGGGKTLDAQELLPYARAIKRSFPSIGLGVAGGLGPATLDLVDPFIDELGIISWDSQSKCRKSGNSLDPVDWDYAEDYVRKSARKLKSFGLL